MLFALFGIIPEDQLGGKFQIFLFQCLAEQATDADLEHSCLYPPLTDIKEVSFRIALQVADEAYNENLATVMPRPDNLADLVNSLLYKPDYISNIPKPCRYPEGHEIL